MQGQTVLYWQTPLYGARGCASALSLRGPCAAILHLERSQEIIMHRIPVRQIMTPDVVTIGPEKLVADAAQVMDELGLRRLPVVDENGALLGMITDSDILQVEAAGDAIRNSYEPEADEEWLAVADVMTREVVTIDVDATVGELAVLMIESKVGGVPVVEWDNPLKPQVAHVVGIVTETDIFAMIAEAWIAYRQSLATA
jgi:acetoin utilization protein AcuB